LTLPFLKTQKHAGGNIDDSLLISNGAKIEQIMHSGMCIYESKYSDPFGCKWISKGRKIGQEDDWIDIFD
jgi:hypothetical protein